MTSIALQDWDHFSKSWSLDVLTGEAWAQSHGDHHGYIHFPAPGEQATAVYAESGRLWFQYGARRWDLSSITMHIDIGKTGTNVFTLQRHDRVEAEITYPSPPLEELSAEDPTFDGLDAELEDFLHWLCNQHRDPEWQRTITEAWQRGFARF